MKSNYNFIQVYNVWINGRAIDGVDQHFPLNTKVDRNWHSDFKLATKDYFGVKVKDSDGDFGDYSEIYQDYIITLFVIDIDINEFEEKFDMKFDIENENVQEMIPYYVDYDFTVVAERICKFKR